jgi:hypothetical protein
LITVLVVFYGCSDSSIVKFYDKNFSNPPCLKMVVFPPDRLITSTLEKLYDFDENCSYRFQISKKSDISCNSTYNVDKKAISNFPSGYIKIDILDDNKILYGYYKDLSNQLTDDDIKNAFKRVQRDLKLKK